MQLTPAQRRALDAARHIALTANAGSGKTRVLVERYVGIVARGLAPDKVVALTYTEKAAGELRRRIAGRVEDEIAAATDPAALEAWETLRDALPIAFVGTIHSFCARILREFPVEAGVDAAFTVMEEVDSQEAIRAAIAGALQEVLRKERDDPSRRDLLDLLRRLGRERALRALTRLIERRDLLERLDGAEGLYRRTDEEVLRLWDDELTTACAREMSAEQLLSNLGIIIAAASDRGKGEVQPLVAVLEGKGSVQERATACIQLMHAMFTREGKPRKSFFGNGEPAPEVMAALARVHWRRRLLDPLTAYVAEGVGRDTHPALLRASRTLLAAAHNALGRYAAAKADDARMDFEDLQIVMRELLKNEGVRAALSRRFRYVMVDEYQDTNTLQLEILLPLLQNLDSGNLFIVGDPKQSIYRFRDADVRVFDRTRSTIANVSGGDSAQSLAESFRPLRDIAAFVNALFSPLWRGERGNGGSYEPLVVARVNDAPGSVEVLLAGGGAGEPLNEPELLARRILALRRDGTRVFDETEQPRPVAFRDIAVLLRARTGLEEFEHAFLRNGIPFQVSGGVGFYQTQDVYDVFNYLRFLLNPDDDLALAGILRSPFFTVSDADLFRIARGRTRGSLWNAISSGAPLVGAVPALSRALGFLTEDLSVGVRLPVAELLTRIIRRTHVAGVLSATSRGPQAIANLQKLVTMARGFEAQGYTGLSDFAARLRRLIEEDPKEAQASIDAEADAVRIMTVHAAKGLEFPVVLLPRIHAASPPEKEPFIDESLGVGFRLSTNDGPLPPIAEYLRQSERMRQREEEQRILYVAATRARDVLILSGDPSAVQKGRDSWFTWVRQAFPELAGTPDELVRGAITTRYRQSGESASVTDERHDLRVRIVRSLAPEPPALPATAKAGEVRIAIAPLRSEARGEIFSASKIRTYSECPAAYYYRYVLGYPLGRGPFAPEGEEDLLDRDQPAELRGRIFHAVMEKAGELVLDGDAVERTVRTIISRDLLPDEQHAASLGAEVSRLVRAVLSSEAWKGILAGTEARTEFSISAALGDEFITGTIDRLYRDAAGLWTVLDYKTDSVTEELAGSRAEGYWPQLTFYGVMVRRLFSVDSVRTRILFTSLPELPFEKILGARELNETKEYIAATIGRIKRGEFPPSPGSCRECPFSPARCYMPFHQIQ
ncbi:MAG: UvrD-helicase domain-containing protein [Bacteroidota bacterium]